MNKVFFLMIFWALFPLLSQAQVTLAPKAGINYMWVGAAPEGFTTAGSEKGWQAGLDVRIGKRAYFQPGIHYVSTGTTIEKLDDIKNISTGDVAFMKIPANVGYKLINTALLKFRVHAGAAASKVIKVNPSHELTADDFNTWHYGANVGAGLDLLIFSLDANYEWGLTDLYKNTGGSKASIFSVTLGLKF